MTISGDLPADHDSVNDCIFCPLGMHPSNVSLSLSSVRLTDGSNAHEGRVEIFNPNTDEWGSIDNDYWSDDNGAVVCKMLGLGPLVSVSYRSQYGPSTGTQYAGFECNGDETSLFDCRWVWGNQAWGIKDIGTTNYDDVGVVCSYDAGSCVTCENGKFSDVVGSPCKSCPIGYGTIDDSNSSFHDSSNDCMKCGPGMVSVNGICELCMPGYYSANETNSKCWPCPIGLLTYGNESTDFNSISKCQACPKGTVFPSIIVPRSPSVRLRGGKTKHDGMVEILNPANNQWGSITKNMWNEVNGAVVCKQLGLGPLISAAKSLNYGYYDGTQYFGFFCDGAESSLLDCTLLGGQMWSIYSSGNYIPGNAAVVCSKDFSPCPVCDSGYTDQARSLVCKSCPLGYVTRGFTPSDHDDVSDCYPCGKH
jgi:hypothetical protein